VRSVRTTGHDLAQAALEVSAVYGLSVFFLGAAPGVGELAAATARREFPGVSIAGVYSPPHAPYPYETEENAGIVDQINRSGADIVLVALGCPKQDYWIADHAAQLRASIAIGVGCVFDVLAGSVGRAPKAMQSAGLEWLYRLHKEPRRLLGRYARDSMFVARLALREALNRDRGGAA
jgi:N-acetylglucosaminyldiphosphoundecaprenol N-acetyl-beta-D-mannosaminyltransferase